MDFDSNLFGNCVHGMFDIWQRVIDSRWWCGWCVMHVTKVHTTTIWHFQPHAASSSERRRTVCVIISRCIGWLWSITRVLFRVQCQSTKSRPNHPMNVIRQIIVIARHQTNNEEQTITPPIEQVEFGGNRTDINWQSSTIRRMRKSMRSVISFDKHRQTDNGDGLTMNSSQLALVLSSFVAAFVVCI